MGLTRQTEKGQWEAGSWIHHLGLKIESVDGVNRISVTPQRVGKIRRLAKALLWKAKKQRRLVLAQELASFVGTFLGCAPLGREYIQRLVRAGGYTKTR